MSLKAFPRMRRLRTVGLMAALSFGCWLQSPVWESVAAFQQSQQAAEEEQAVEIAIPGEHQFKRRMPVRAGGRFGMLMRRNQCHIIKPEAAGDFTALEVQVDSAVDHIDIRLSLIYNDLSNPQWRVDRKEKVVAAFGVRDGEAVQTLELVQFGIEPLEIRFMTVKPAVLLPGRDFLVNNQTSKFGGHQPNEVCRSLLSVLKEQRREGDRGILSCVWEPRLGGRQRRVWNRARRDCRWS